MRSLIIGGVVLMLLGFFGIMNACLSDQSTNPVGSTAPIPTEPDDQSSPLWGAVAGLTLAVGAGLLLVGFGHWSAPVPSKKRPANPWNEQPKDSGEPPVGLV